MAITVMASKLLRAAASRKVVASATSGFFSYQDAHRSKFNDPDELADAESEELDAEESSAATSHGYDLPASLDMVASVDVQADVDESVDESLTEGSEEANDFFLLLQSYLRLVPNPTDAQVHKLAEAMDISPEELEQGIYHTLSILLEDEELSEDARELIQQNLDRQGATAQQTLHDENDFIDTDEDSGEPVAVFSEAEAEADGTIDTGVDSIDDLSERDGAV